jgi:hypothetical protein
MRIRLFHKLFLITAGTALVSVLAMVAVLSLSSSSWLMRSPVRSSAIPIVRGIQVLHRMAGVHRQVEGHRPGRVRRWVKAPLRGMVRHLVRVGREGLRVVVLHRILARG